MEKRELIKAVIFDMDGVLVDSQPLHFKVDMLVLEKCGIPASLETVQKYAGMSNAGRWAKYKNDFFIQYSVEEIITMHREIITSLLDSTGIAAMDYVADTLNMLKNKGISCSVASSSSYQFIYSMLDKIKLRGLVDIVISGEDMEKSKPAPDIFLRAANEHNAQLDECVVIEDSANGVKASVAAGIRCIGFKNENSGEQDLSLASFVITSFNELLIDQNWLYKN